MTLGVRLLHLLLSSSWAPYRSWSKPSSPPLPSKGVHPQDENVLEDPNEAPALNAGALFVFIIARCHAALATTPISSPSSILPSAIKRTWSPARGRAGRHDGGPHIKRGGTPLHLPRAMNTCPPWHVLVPGNTIEAPASNTGAPFVLIITRCHAAPATTSISSPSSIPPSAVEWAWSLARGRARARDLGPRFNSGGFVLCRRPSTRC
ncbi:hypothetical protein BKA93DRAFT_754622 [Sparassis latifolia]